MGDYGSVPAPAVPAFQLLLLRIICTAFLLSCVSFSPPESHHLASRFALSVASICVSPTWTVLDAVRSFECNCNFGLRTSFLTLSWQSSCTNYQTESNSVRLLLFSVCCIKTLIFKITISTFITVSKIFNFRTQLYRQPYTKILWTEQTVVNLFLLNIRKTLQSVSRVFTKVVRFIYRAK